MKNIKTILFIFTFFLVSFSVVQAAEMYFVAPKTSYGIGEEMQVAFRISSSNEKINAIEGIVVFPNDLIDFVEVYDNNSMVTAWVEKPSLKNSNQINFSSIIVGGFDGLIDPFQPENKKAGTIANFVFRTKKEGTGSFEIENGAVYLHDGNGTRGKLITVPLSFIVDPTLSSTERKILDDRPPEPFEILIDHSELIFNNQYFAVFQSEDVDSGIAYYKIKEGNNGLWLPVESPYLLRNQKLTSVIKIKAVDKVGNERIITVSPLTPKDLSYLWYILIALILVLIIHYFIDHRQKNVYNINVYE